MCKVYTGYNGTSEIEHGLCACTAKARGLSLRTGARSISHMFTPVYAYTDVLRLGIIGKGPQTFSTVFTHIAGDFGLVAQNPLTENGLLFTILSSSAVPVWDLIKTRIIKLFERKHWLRIYQSVIN